MKTLLINTCTATVAIAIFEDDRLLALSRLKAPREEAEKLQTETEKLFQDIGVSSDMIDRIGVCVGPGGFTSSRIGVCMANTWAFGRQIPLATFSVFDLYPKTIPVVIRCNSHEAWVRTPGSEPEFISRESSESVAELQTDMHEETFPLPSSLQFSHQQAKPWYYKDAKITWSKKIHQQ